MENAMRDGWAAVEGDKPMQDGSLIVEFFRSSKRDIYQSIQQGIPVVNGIDMVKVMQAGEKDSTIFEVNEMHKRRWKEQWKAYQEGREQIGDGRALDMLFPGNPEIVETLKHLHIHTIEQLANTPDGSVSAAFVFTWKQQAQKFLGGIQENRFPQLEHDLEEANARNKQMAEQMALMQQQMATLMARQATGEDGDEHIVPAPDNPEQVRRGPGRPRKAENAS